MNRAFAGVRLQAELASCAAGAAGLVLGLAALDWVGEATGNAGLTRVLVSWAYMPPWSALIQAALAVAILLQLGRPSPARVWAGTGLAAVTGALSAMFVAVNATSRPFALDQVFFSDAVRAAQETWPGRPSAWTALSAALLSVSVAVARLDRRRWTRLAWQVCLAAAVVLPGITVLTYFFEVVLLMGETRSIGQAILSATSLLLLATATMLARPDREPVAWLLARPDRWTLIRLVGMLAGLPIVIGLSRIVFGAAGMRGDGLWVSSIAMGTVVIGLAVFFASQREQKLLIEKELLSRSRAETESERAEVEARYRILADNAVDVVVHIRGLQVVWTSPSLHAAFGDSAEQWIGSDFLTHIHPEDVDHFKADLQTIAAEEKLVATRFRVITADGGCHWVEGHGKPYINAQGNVDGIIGSMRVADDKVEAERKLERLARFDAVTGLVNRAETFTRLESALTGSRTSGKELGVLFCDIDRFKVVNDTWGHVVGDAVLWTVADRIRECLRHGDTVGRTGGDEIIVLLPGLKDLAEATRIAEKIRARIAEPIHESGNTIKVTLSIGATLAIPGESASEITTRADTAMYVAKNAGRNHVTSI